MAQALAGACEELLRGKKVAISFSGGLDSSLLAFLAKDRCEAALYVAGRKSCGDRKAAREAAGIIGLPLIEFDLTAESLPPVVERIVEAIGEPRAKDIEVAVMVPLAFVCGGAKEDFVVTGTGADELFGGYARYARMDEGERAKGMARDYTALKSRGAVSEVACGKLFGKFVLQPFMSSAVEEAVRGCPPESLFHEGIRKALLRAAAMEAGLPPGLAMSAKKAAQYGSGSARLLSRLRKAGAGKSG